MRVQALLAVSLCIPCILAAHGQDSEAAPLAQLRQFSRLEADEAAFLTGQLRHRSQRRRLPRTGKDGDSESSSDEQSDFPYCLKCKKKLVFRCKGCDKHPQLTPKEYAEAKNLTNFEAFYQKYKHKTGFSA